MKPSCIPLTLHLVQDAGDGPGAATARHLHVKYNLTARVIIAWRAQMMINTAPQARVQLKLPSTWAPPHQAPK